MIRLSIFAGMCLTLAACGDGNAAAEQADDARDARGEVLGGSISDEMLPLDTVRSQSPPLVEDSSGEDDDGATAPAAEEPANAKPESPDEPAPAVEAETEEAEAEVAE